MTSLSGLPSIYLYLLRYSPSQAERVKNASRNLDIMPPGSPSFCGARKPLVYAGYEVIHRHTISRTLLALSEYQTEDRTGEIHCKRLEELVSAILSVHISILGVPHLDFMEDYLES